MLCLYTMHYIYTHVMRTCTWGCSNPALVHLSALLTGRCFLLAVRVSLLLQDLEDSNTAGVSSEIGAQSWRPRRV